MILHGYLLVTLTVNWLPLLEAVKLNLKPNDESKIGGAVWLTVISDNAFTNTVSSFIKVGDTTTKFDQAESIGITYVYIWLAAIIIGAVELASKYKSLLIKVPEKVLDVTRYRYITRKVDTNPKVGPRGLK